jgi:hypothetical protein
MSILFHSADIFITTKDEKSIRAHSFVLVNIPYFKNNVKKHKITLDLPSSPIKLVLAQIYAYTCHKNFEGVEEFVTENYLNKFITYNDLTCISVINNQMQLKDIVKYLEVLDAFGLWNEDKYYLISHLILINLSIPNKINLILGNLEEELRYAFLLKILRPPQAFALDSIADDYFLNLCLDLVHMKVIKIKSIFHVIRRTNSKFIRLILARYNQNLKYLKGVKSILLNIEDMDLIELLYGRIDIHIIIDNFMSFPLNMKDLINKKGQFKDNLDVYKELKRLIKRLERLREIKKLLNEEN